MLLIEKKGDEIITAYEWDIQPSDQVYILDRLTNKITELKLQKFRPNQLIEILKDLRRYS